MEPPFGLGGRAQYTPLPKSTRLAPTRAHFFPPLLLLLSPRVELTSVGVGVQQSNYYTQSHTITRGVDGLRPPPARVSPADNTEHKS